MTVPEPEELNEFDGEPAELPGDGEARQPVSRPRARRAWSPDLDAEVAGLLRLLTRQCWLVAGRDDDAIAAVRRNQEAIVDVFRRLGWVLVIERDLVRLRKSPPPRPESWAADGPDPRTCSWFFLMVAAAESLPPKVALSQLAKAARAAASEAGLAPDGSMPERRAMFGALKLLDDRGVIRQIDGELEGFLIDEDAPVLLGIHHNRLLHVIANAGSGNPAADPVAWLSGVCREPDTPRRMRRRLVDDALVHIVDLNDAEIDWLRRRLRGDDGGPLAESFGLEIERRSEGAAFVVPNDAYRYDRELGPLPFPVSGGTVPHAALLLCDHAASDGLVSVQAFDDASSPVPGAGRGPGAGWRGLARSEVLTRLREVARSVGSGRGGWSSELVENLDLLADRVRELLQTRDLLRLETTHLEGAESTIWWFSPATGRWPAPAAEPAKPRRPKSPECTNEPTSVPPETLFDADIHRHPEGEPDAMDSRGGPA